MNRRQMLSAGPAVMALAGAGAGVAVAAPAKSLPSPILDAARRIAALGQEHDAADVPHADGAELDRIWDLIRPQEEVVLAATPSTVAEAMVVLMIASGNLDAQDDLKGAAKSAAARAIQCLAGLAGVDVMDFGGDLYLPPDVAPSCMMGRAA